MKALTEDYSDYHVELHTCGDLCTIGALWNGLTGRFPRIDVNLVEEEFCDLNSRAVKGPDPCICRLIDQWLAEHTA